jgi:hypothetical protein
MQQDINEQYLIEETMRRTSSTEERAQRASTNSRPNPAHPLPAKVERAQSLDENGKKKTFKQKFQGYIIPPLLTNSSILRKKKAKKGRSKSKESSRTGDKKRANRATQTNQSRARTFS